MESNSDVPSPSEGETETLFSEMKHEDIIIPLTYVTLKTEVENFKDCESGTYSETTTICAMGGYNIHIKTGENTHSIILNECQIDENTQGCNSYDIQLLTTGADNDVFDMSYEEEPVFVTLTTVKTEPEGYVEDDGEDSDKTICSLGGYEIDTKNENSLHFLEDSSEINPEENNDDSGLYDTKPSSATSERDIFNIEYEEEPEFSNHSAKNEPLDYIEDEVEYYNGFENDVKSEIHIPPFIKEQPLPTPLPPPQPPPLPPQSSLTSQFQIAEIKLNEALLVSPEDFPYSPESMRKQKGRKQHICPVCKETYTRRQSLEKHLPIHFGYRPYGCYMCKIYFKDRSVRDVHVQEHFANQPFFCHMCMKPFMLISHFTKHVLVHKGEKLFSCGFCGNSFVDRSALDEHFLCHIAKRPHHCDICKKSFRMKWQYEKHQIKHVGDRKFGKKTVRKYVRRVDRQQKNTLEGNQKLIVPQVDPKLPHEGDQKNARQHVRKYVRKNDKKLMRQIDKKLVHQKDKKCARQNDQKFSHQNDKKHVHQNDQNHVKQEYLCHICKQSFNHKNSLELHMKSHSDNTPVECDVCRKTFQDKKQLESHAHTHKRNGSYFCDTCKKKYSLKARFYKHRCIQREKRFFSCGYCDKTFKWKSLLESHLSTHQIEVRYSCEVCKKGFSAKSSRDMHRRTHKNTYSCRICGKLFNEKIIRDRHLRRHTLQERRNKMLMEA